jgi:hypothetical protein
LDESFANCLLSHFFTINTPTILSACDEILCPCSQSISHGAFENPQPPCSFIGGARVRFPMKKFNGHEKKYQPINLLVTSCFPLAGVPMPFVPLFE